MAAAVELYDVGEKRAAAGVRKANSSPRACDRQQAVRADVALEVDRQVVVAGCATASPDGTRAAVGVLRAAPRASHGGVERSPRWVTSVIRRAIERVPAADDQINRGVGRLRARTARMAPSDISRSPIRSSRSSRIRCRATDFRPALETATGQGSPKGRHRPGRPPSAPTACRYRGDRTSAAPRARARGESPRGPP